MKHGPLRDALTLVAVFAVLLGGLFLYTGVWPPAVIVESSSMMHPDEEVSYGRWGTIDPGDLVLVKKVLTPEDVSTLVEEGRSRYGMSGDVVIYFPRNDHQTTPIIHRAVAYVDVKGTGGSTEYWVRWAKDSTCEGGAVKKEERWCVYGASGIYAPSVPISLTGSTPQNPQPYKPEHSGFLTKGDNPFTNRNIDQVSLYQGGPVTLEWIEGKGRAEVPWLGLLKLSLAGKPNERNPPAEWVKIGSAYAPKDLWVMLGISLFLLVGVPLIYDAYKAIDARRKRALEGPTGLAATSAGPTTVALSWSSSRAAHNYRIYRDDLLVGSTRDTRYEDAGLEAGRSYWYAVTAVDEKGNESPRSPAVSARTPGSSPALPT